MKSLWKQLQGLKQGLRQRQDVLHDVLHNVLHKILHKILHDVLHNVPHKIPHKILHKVLHKIPHKILHNVPHKILHKILHNVLHSVLDNTGHCLVIIPLVAGAMLVGTEVGVFRSLEWGITDQFYNFRPSGKQGASLDLTSLDILSRFAIVTIDEADIASVPQWPMSDAVMSTLFQNILRQQPRLVSMNIYRDLAVEPGHAQLQQLFATTPNLFGIEQVIPPAIAPPPVLAQRGQVSASDLLVDRDGVIRRGLLKITKLNGQTVAGLGTSAALRYLEQEGIRLETVETEESDRTLYRLGNIRFSPLSNQDTLYKPQEKGQSQLLIHYLAPLDQFPHISLQQVLSQQIPPDFFKDRIVLIGSKAPSLNDNYRTPLNNSLWGEEALMPGIVIHANMAAQLLGAALQNQRLIQRPPIYLDYAWILLWTTYGTVAGLLYVNHRWLTWILLSLGVAIVTGTTYLLFFQGWLLLTFTPLFALGLSSTISLFTSLWTHLHHSYKILAHQKSLLEDANQTLKQLNDKYSRFVPFDYLQFLGRESILDLELGDHTICKMAIMFSDIRNFTSMSESMTPQNTFDFVNSYLQKVSPEIRNHGGIIVKFMGDSILSIFPGNADNCLKAAIAKQKKLVEYNLELKEKGLQPIQIGIGIHVGNAMLGVIGEESRMQGDVLSDAVNLASRLESLTKRYGSSIIISGDTLLELESPDHYHTRLLDQVVVKGRSKPIALFEVLDGESTKSFQLKKVCQATFEQGLVFYFNKDFTQAHNHFSRVLSINPGDLTSQLYLDRIAYFQSYGVPDNWRGVWHFQDK